ncbi:Rrf2 family transcriptional regulator [Helicobacter sp. MIT 01-3238]|uniref:Rrf2 family transcriptional regulator n=1 Tax=Helicobacter sp. MIT 01-3238 TaxID=398627 RepID=UPI000E1E70E9|nr:Rrf2 family transcriptional regulator [Helicobacter sp. MIT 01-3238]RDU55214.1 hypothetical protein CQA40_01955 [Helicobacter sp. MIT 01-3238]
MQIPSRFSIAIHICMCLEFFDAHSESNTKKPPSKKRHCKPMTGEALAESVGAHSVIIRNILAQLKSANLIETRRGGSGARLAKSPSKISLLDIFNAVQSTKSSQTQASVANSGAKTPTKSNQNTQASQNQLFRFHTNPNELCPLGKHIHGILDIRFLQAQSVLESYLSTVLLSELISELDELR